ncbi:MAG: DinB family protein [bacterium]|nr:DinB family protein [bacterium]
MDTIMKPMIWHQFGAAIDMLENTIISCPGELWSDRSQKPEYWYLVYHTLFWLDLYLSGPTEGFLPPEPFTLDELDPEGIMPEQPHTKEVLRSYLQHCREKCKTTIEALTDEKASRRFAFGWGEANFAELLLYNMRHVQHGTGQLNLILRQQTDFAPKWVGKTKDEEER